MAGNVVAHLDKKDNIFPNKENVKNKIDGIVTIIMAVSAVVFGEDTTSTYEEEEILIL
jgi:phage terminase large subunit-like protein